jgi:HSP20 family molecular chaperone IbpA
MVRGAVLFEGRMVAAMGRFVRRTLTMPMGPQNGGWPPEGWLKGPFLVGFERTRTLVERAARADADGYPPFNIEEFGEGSGKGFRIIVAVAGFSAEEVSATLEGRELVVAGVKAESADRVYLHRGIATRRFRRVFALGEGIEVQEANYAHGLLSIDLKIVPPESRVRTIPIKVADPKLVIGPHDGAEKAAIREAAE